jgi:hypothetical protein
MEGITTETSQIIVIVKGAQSIMTGFYSYTWRGDRYAGPYRKCYSLENSSGELSELMGGKEHLPLAFFLFPPSRPSRSHSSVSAHPDPADGQ